MNVLFLTTILPRQQRMGSEVASQCFIDALRQTGHRVLTVGYMRQDDPFELERSELLIARRYIETQRARWYPLLWMLLGFAKGLPYSGVKYYSQRYIQQVKALLHQPDQPFDLVVIDHPQLGWLQPFLPPQQKLVMIAHNLEHQLYHQQAALSSRVMRWIYCREARLIEQLETDLAQEADQVWALSQTDAEYFSKLGQKTLTMTLPANLSPVRTRPQPKAFDVGLIGSWAWKPNAEGLRWFLQSVYPLLPRHLSVQVAGRGAEWLTERYPQIRYLGFVPDVQVFMGQARAVAIPTLSGSGIQIKTLDAIASGSKIVATPVALRGLNSWPATVQVAEQPQQFAAALLAACAHNSTGESTDLESSEYCSSSSADIDFAQGTEWYRNRQIKFLAEVSEAVSNL